MCAELSFPSLPRQELPVHVCTRLQLGIAYVRALKTALQVKAPPAVHGMEGCAPEPMRWDPHPHPHPAFLKRSRVSGVQLGSISTSAITSVIQTLMLISPTNVPSPSAWTPAVSGSSLPALRSVLTWCWHRALGHLPAREF